MMDHRTEADMTDRGVRQAALRASFPAAMGMRFARRLIERGVVKILPHCQEPPNLGGWKFALPA